MTEARALADQLAGTITDQRVLEAIAAVPRHRFVPAALQDQAYADKALPLATGQSISQPLVVARMLELLQLRGGERVLDVGTGTGYHAALLAQLAGEVVTIERDPRLSATASATLAQLGLGGRIRCVVGDGWNGVPGFAPYDAINVAAAPGTEVPPALLTQLADPGTLVIPLGVAGDQHLIRVRRAAASLLSETLEKVSFVPLVPDGPA